MDWPHPRMGGAGFDILPSGEPRVVFFEYSKISPRYTKKMSQEMYMIIRQFEVIFQIGPNTPFF